jgi:Spy/CpxP family protein refolding chaperone
MDQHDDRNNGSNARPASRGGLWGGVVAASLLAALLACGAILSVPLVSAASGWWARSGHWGHHGHGQFDAETARERAEFAASWVLRWVDASDEQETQVRAIITASVEELVPLSERHRQNREAFIAELSRPTIDREAIEAIRAAELELAEEASSQLVAAFADIAEVLTPEQRAELIALAERFRH